MEPMLMKENVPSVLASPPLVVLEEIYFRAKMVSLAGFQNTINLSGWVAEVHIQAIVTIVLRTKPRWLSRKEESA